MSNSTKIFCVICAMPVGEEGQSQFAAFGGLPSPCCKHCFEANDYTCKSLTDVAAKSMDRRRELKAFPFEE